MQRVLVIDDDVELCELLTQYLKAEGFDLEAVGNGEQGVARAHSGEHALVVLDVMLPGMQGFEVLRQIRAQSHIPVLMLTARGDDLDRILGLEMGADDYLPKPFNPRELAARIRAILRRAKPQPPELALQLPEPILLGDLEIDNGARVVRRGGERLNLTTVEFQLLEVLLRAAGRVVTREVLVREVLGRDFSPFDRSIDVHVSNLRKKLGLHHDGTERIKGVRGFGYLYAAPDHLRRGEGSDAAPIP
jgi:two-component system, OmpR family, response regulator CpxR